MISQIDHSPRPKHFHFDVIGATELHPSSISNNFPAQEVFLSELVSREANNLSTAQLSAMHNARFAAFGLGVMGRVMPELARLGASKFVLVDIDGVEASNLQRQEAKVGHLPESHPDFDPLLDRSRFSTPKPMAVAEGIFDINPYAKVGAFTEHLTDDQIEAIVKQSDIVCWGLDAPRVIWKIHEFSQKYGKVVVSGLDLGPWTMLRWYDYSLGDTKILNGTVDEKTAIALDNPATKLLFLALTVPNIEQKVPYELMYDLREIALGRKAYLSQTSLAVGVFASQLPRLISDILVPTRKGKIKKEVLYKNDYHNLQLSERLTKEKQRLQMLKDPIVQQILGLNGKLNPVRYASACIQGLTRALIV